MHQQFQRFAIQELHGDEGTAAFFGDLIDGADGSTRKQHAPHAGNAGCMSELGPLFGVLLSLRNRLLGPIA
jgi:hypothetical protein